jgi:hypothetical protein
MSALERVREEDEEEERMCALDRVSDPLALLFSRRICC